MVLRLDSPLDAVAWLRARVSGELTVDSRQVGRGDGFVAWPGAAVDGRRFVQQAFASGAAACLVEQQGIECLDFDSANDSVATLDGLKLATGSIADAWYAHPSRKLDVFAFTGTNGKTSSAWWLAQALAALGPAHRRQAGIIGTLGVGLPDGSGNEELRPRPGSGLTTPDPITLQRSFHRFVHAGVTACAIEASSIGLAEHRLDASRIRCAVFTNFSQDHLDYHGSMDAYWQAKRQLFDWPGLQAAVINIDDGHGVRLARSLQATPSVDVWTVACGRPARLHARRIEQSSDGLRFDVCEAHETQAVATTLLGGYNVLNLLGVIGALRSQGVALSESARACAALTPVPGRLQRVPAPAGQPLVLVDYAHTPDALAQVLGTLRPLASARAGRLHCVFGCGGDRDRSKRAPMAAAAERAADCLVLTSDNPRSEDPQAIILQALQGLQQPDRAIVEADRARAIRRVIFDAAPVDLICIAGKGHETTQEVSGRKLPFSDTAVAAEALAERAAGVPLEACMAAAAASQNRRSVA